MAVVSKGKIKTVTIGKADCPLYLVTSLPARGSTPVISYTIDYRGRMFNAATEEEVVKKARGFADGNQYGGWYRYFSVHHAFDPVYVKHTAKFPAEAKLRESIEERVVLIDCPTPSKIKLKLNKIKEQASWGDTDRFENQRDIRASESEDGFIAACPEAVAAIIAITRAAYDYERKVAEMTKLAVAACKPIKPEAYVPPIKKAEP